MTTVSPTVPESETATDRTVTIDGYTFIVDEQGRICDQPSAVMAIALHDAYAARDKSLKSTGLSAIAVPDEWVHNALNLRRIMLGVRAFSVPTARGPVLPDDIARGRVSRTDIVKGCRTYLSA